MSGFGAVVGVGFAGAAVGAGFAGAAVGAGFAGTAFFWILTLQTKRIPFTWAVTVAFPADLAESLPALFTVTILELLLFQVIF